MDVIHVVVAAEVQAYRRSVGLSSRISLIPRRMVLENVTVVLRASTAPSVQRRALAASRRGPHRLTRSH
jgi:hypothetical protein